MDGANGQNIGLIGYHFQLQRVNGNIPRGKLEYVNPSARPSSQPSGKKKKQY